MKVTPDQFTLAPLMLLYGRALKNINYYLPSMSRFTIFISSSYILNLDQHHRKECSASICTNMINYPCYFITMRTHY